MDEFDRLKAQKDEILAQQAAKPSAREAKLEAALRHIAGLDDHADGVVGMVDHPHIKALRVASRVAKEALQPAADGEETNGN